MRTAQASVALALGVHLAGGLALTAQVDRPDRPEFLLEAPTGFQAPRAEGRVHSLSSGARVVVVEDHDLPLFELAAALPVGEALDTDDNLGVAAVAAALLRRGGAGELGARAFDERVDHLGFRASSVGGFRRSGVTLSGASDFLDEGLELFAAMLEAPRFEAQALATLLQQVASGVGRNDPGSRFEREWKRLAHGRNGVRARELATVAHLDRDRLRAYHRRCFDPKRTVIAVSGNVETQSVLERLEALLRDWRAEGECAAAKGLTLEMGPPGFRLVDERTQQAHVVLGHEGARRAGWDDPDAWGLIVLSEILAGQGAVSRLGARLREREALVYQVSASLGIGSPDEALFEVRLATAPHLVGRALDAVAEEMRRLRETRVSDLELQLARRSLVDAFPLLWESAEATAGWFADDLILGRPHSYWQVYRDRVSAVTADQVRKLARKHLRPNDLRGVIVGPGEAVARSLESSTVGRGHWSRVPAPEAAASP